MMKLSIAAVMLAAGLGFAIAQPDKPAAPPAPPAAEPAQRDLGTAEGADGTKMPVLSRTEHTFIIEDLKIGAGAECKPGAIVTIHYHGTLPDGTMFDSTRGGQPVTYPLPRLVMGWQAGIPGMKVGGVRRLTIPYILGYGEDGMKDEEGKTVIPPKATLLFSIELVDVKNRN